MNKSALFSTAIISGSPKAVNVLSPLLKQKCQLTLIGDYHSSLNDERGADFTCYSARMAQYGRSDMQELAHFFMKAFEGGSDAIILLGDIISFPSEKGIETLSGMIKDSPIPVYYTAGNHDWHYEGMPGSDKTQRQEWIDRRLLPLYCGRNPLNYAVKVNGIKLLMIDNSVYEILPSQLEFCRRELADGTPAVICCHIPFYLGMPFHSVTGFGCGHPDWGAATDPYCKIERRERWAPHLSPETFAYCEEVLTAENVLGITAGHFHEYSLATVNSKFQLVVPSYQSTNLTLSGF